MIARTTLRGCKGTRDRRIIADQSLISYALSRAGIVGLLQLGCEYVRENIHTYLVYRAVLQQYTCSILPCCCILPGPATVMFISYRYYGTTLTIIDTVKI